MTAAVHGEKYLTVAAAQKLCFPQAKRFEERVIRFKPEEARQIERNSGVRVSNAGNKVIYAYEDTTPTGVLFLDHVLGKHEIIDYGVAISPDGKILQIEILEYRESYGGEIRNPKWRRQFAGKDTSSALRLNKDVYNISGATISCRSVTEGIKRVLATFDLLCRPEFVALRLQDAASPRP
jgi:Na+-translocating ferredoxin:NAD+ oxidoreductase RnfG subunit